jgi:DNA transformation protein and related proteins
MPLPKPLNAPEQKRGVGVNRSSPHFARRVPSELLQLRNLGATVVKRLQAIGIQTRADLAHIGAPEAYRRMAALAAPHRLAVCYYLYSLEGALQDRHWDDFSDEEKAQLRLQAGMRL